MVRRGAEGPLQVEATQGRKGANAFVAQQLTGGRFPVEADLQPAVDARVLAVNRAGPVRSSLHKKPAWSAGERRNSRRRRRFENEKKDFYLNILPADKEDAEQEDCWFCSEPLVFEPLD